MLKVYDVALDLLSALRPIIGQIRQHDSSLADQLQRAACSVPLHIAEGSFARGRNRAAKYQIGCSEAREALACCDCGVRLGYIEPMTPSTTVLFREVIGTLVVNIRRG